MTDEAFWKELTIGDLGKVVTGKTPPTSNSEYFGGDIPFVTPTDMDGRRVISTTERYLTEKGAEAVKGSKLPARSVMVSCIGSQMGKVAISGKPCVTNQQINSIIVSPEYSELFVYYSLSLRGDEIRYIGSGSAVPILNKSDFSNLPILVPPLPEQRAIAGILGALDDKIELNRRMNQTLESMARAVFAEMMKDEGGRMKVGTVGEDLHLTMGQSPPGETYNEESEGMPFFQGRADFGFRYPVNRVYCIAPTRFAKAGDTLVSVRAPVGDVNMAKEKCAIGRGVAAVRHKTGSRSYTYYAMKFLEEDFARFEAEGTVFGSINKADFQNLEIGIPTTEQIEQFEKTYYPIDQMIENNEKESRTLARLRDALLPKLMRGEVRVK
jgi:type I restriction enzyme S subunit